MKKGTHDTKVYTFWIENLNRNTRNGLLPVDHVLLLHVQLDRFDMVHLNLGKSSWRMRWWSWRWAWLQRRCRRVRSPAFLIFSTSASPTLLLILSLGLTGVDPFLVLHLGLLRVKAVVDWLHLRHSTQKMKIPFLSELKVQPLSHRRVRPTERKKSSKAECRWIIEVTTGAQPFTIFRQPSQMFFERHLKTGDGLDQLVDQEPFVNCVMIVLQLVSHAGCPLLLRLLLLWWGFDRWWGVATRWWGDFYFPTSTSIVQCTARRSTKK